MTREDMLDLDNNDNTRFLKTSMKIYKYTKGNSDLNLCLYSYVFKNRCFGCVLRKGRMNGFKCNTTSTADRLAQFEIYFSRFTNEELLEVLI